MTKPFDPFDSGDITEAEATTWMLSSAAEMAAQAMTALRTVKALDDAEGRRGVPVNDGIREQSATIMGLLEQLPGKLGAAIQPPKRP